jgi:hypothetical protein
MNRSLTRPAMWNRAIYQRSFLLPFCAGLVVLADYLFYGHPLGWCLALFIGIMTAGVVIRTPSLWRFRDGRWAGMIAFALCVLSLLALAEEPTGLAISMAILSLGTLVLVSRGGFSWSVAGWLVRWGELLINIPVRTILDSYTVSRWMKKHPQNRSSILGRVFRWIVPLLAGLVFILLFSFANPIIEKWARAAFRDLFNLFDWLPELLEPSRIALWVFIGVGAYGLLRYRGRSGKSGAISVPPVVQTHPASAHHFIVRCLIVFNLVFAMQTCLDVVYLFGGAALPPGMTYTEYAHRGAYPLVATALLAGIFVLAAFRTGGPAHRSRLARQLVYLWIVQNIFLMYSTIFRTWLYINVSLLTRLRVAVFIWVFLIALGFVYIIIKIRSNRSNGWLLNANALTLFAVLFVCAFINFSGLIADFNVHHCRQAGGRGEPLDASYLAHLGTPALPAIEFILPRISGADRQELLTAQERLNGELEESLADWRGWTLRRQRIASETQGRTLALPVAATGLSAEASR